MKWVKRTQHVHNMYNVFTKGYFYIALFTLLKQMMPQVKPNTINKS